MGRPSRGQVRYHRKRYLEAIAKARAARGEYLMGLARARSLRNAYFESRADGAREAYLAAKRRVFSKGGLRDRYLAAKREREERRERYLELKRLRSSRGRPKIITARQLGLRFQYLWGPKGKITKLAGHYDAGPQVRTERELVERVLGIHRYHRQIGYGGISYEAVVGPGVVVFANPMDRKSAAVAGQNTGLVSICVPGTDGDRMDERTRETVRWLVENWHTSAVPKAHRLPVKAKSLVRLGHREFPGQSTRCPGDYLVDYRKVW